MNGGASVFKVASTGAVTVSGTSILNAGYFGSAAVNSGAMYISSAPLIGVSSGATLAWSSTSNPNNVGDVNISRNSAGVLQLGTTAANALGSLKLVDLTGTGNVIFATAGKGVQYQSGTGARAGNATLVAGTVTVTNTTVTANTIVTLTRKTSGGTIGTAITYTLSAGASFTINSDNPLDTSTFSYVLDEVN